MPAASLIDGSRTRGRRTLKERLPVHSGARNECRRSSYVTYIVCEEALAVMLMDSGIRSRTTSAVDERAWDCWTTCPTACHSPVGGPQRTATPNGLTDPKHSTEALPTELTIGGTMSCWRLAAGFQRAGRLVLGGADNQGIRISQGPPKQGLLEGHPNTTRACT